METLLSSMRYGVSDGSRTGRGVRLAAAWPVRAAIAAGAGAVLGMGCAASVTWLPAFVSLSALALLELPNATIGKLYSQPSVAIVILRALSTLAPSAIGYCAMQLDGGWWIGLGIAASTHVGLWQAVVVALMAGVQTAVFASCLALARAGLAAMRLHTAPGIAWCVAWGAGESLRELGPTGYGYTSLGQAFIDAPGAAGWLPLVGVHGLSVLVGGLAWMCARGVAAGIVGVTDVTDRRRRVALAAAGLVAFAAAGRAAAAVEWTQPAGERLALAVVQDDADVRHAGGEAARDVNAQRLYDALAAVPRGGVVLTPETHFLSLLPAGPDDFWDAVRDRAAERGVYAVVGMPQAARDEQGEQMLNALVEIAPLRTALYAKERMVPGAEALPFARVFGGVYRHAFDGTRRAERAAPPELVRPLYVGDGFVGASICHELSFETTVADRASGSGWLFNAADDAWIPSAAYRAQMEVIARARALAFAKPVVRASDGGASLLVDERGAVLARGPLHEAVTLRWSLQPRAGATPFERFARPLFLAPIVVLAALAAGGAGAALRRGLRRATS